MTVKFMEKQDKNFVMSIDKHVNDTEYKKRVYTKTGYIMLEKDVPMAMMHYSVLWDNLPFLNFILLCKNIETRDLLHRHLLFGKMI